MSAPPTLRSLPLMLLVMASYHIHVCCKNSPDALVSYLTRASPDPRAYLRLDSRSFASTCNATVWRGAAVEHSASLRVDSLSASARCEGNQMMRARIPPRQRELRAELARTSTIWRRHGNAQMTAPALFLRFELIAQDVITTCSARTGCHELTVWQTVRLGTDERAGTFGTRRTGAIRDGRGREWVWRIARNCH